jgi:hypothetical protein
MIGTARISTGLNLRGLSAAIVYGVLREVSVLLQRGGQVGHDGEEEALVLIMYKPWIHTADIPSSLADSLSLSDPDQPLVSACPGHIPTKQERTSVAMYQLLCTLSLCRRSFFAKYLDDSSVNVLMVTARVCCSSSKCHTSSSFDPSTFFLGRVGHLVSVVDTKTRKAPLTMCPKANAKIL